VHGQKLVRKTFRPGFLGIRLYPCVERGDLMALGLLDLYAHRQNIAELTVSVLLVLPR